MRNFSEPWKAWYLVECMKHFKRNVFGCKTILKILSRQPKSNDDNLIHISFTFMKNWIYKQKRIQRRNLRNDCLYSPWTWLISEFWDRISSANFWAVGKTSVWCTVIKYCTNFCSWSLFIWKRVSEMGRCSLTWSGLRMRYKDSATTWAQ